MENNISKININRKEWILLLLYAKGKEGFFCEPIRGRIKLMKELFILGQTIKPQIFYEFVPYLYGPCSFELYEDLEVLTRERLVDIFDEYKDGHGLYSLTKEGVEKTQKIFDSLDKAITDKINQIKIELNQLSFMDLLKKIYNEYPDFAKKSMVVLPKEL